MKAGNGLKALNAGLLAFFAIFFVLPILTTVKGAFFGPDGSFSMEFVLEVFANPIYGEGLWNSLWLAAWSTVGCLVVALPLSLIYVRCDYPGRTILNTLMLLPMVLPPFVGAIGVKAMLGTTGSLNSLLSGLGLMDSSQPIDWLGHSQMLGIVIMNVLHLYPILYLNVAAALGNLDPTLEEAAANLGCPPLKQFFRITIPLIMPGVFSGGTITFIWAFTELGVPLVFEYDRVTSVQIFNSLRDLSGNPFPYALVVVMLTCTALFFGLSKLLFNPSATGGGGGGRASMGREIKKLPASTGTLCALGFLSVIMLAVLPHAGVVLLSLARDWYGSVLPADFTMAHFQGALGHELTLRAVSNSLKYASLATFLDLVIGIGIAYIVVRTRLPGRQFLDAMSMMPLAVPGLVMAFGYLAMSREGGWFHWLRIGEDPVVLLIIAYSIRRLPYVVRAASAGLQQVSPALEEAAQNLGATPMRALQRITLPLVAPNLIAGGLLAFSFAMLEVSDSMVLAEQTRHYPITKAIYSLMASLGNGPSLAAALGVWAMIFLGVTMAGASILLGKRLGTLFR
ncbi:MAG: iron ABC transporter permease [Verrucomicrobiaceae bacterium]|nr:iron ABC transporter permease [Verrucomicrobiaceae bacterium]